MRRDVYGSPDGSPNLQHVASGRKFNAAFSRLETAPEVRVHGKTFRATAAIVILKSLGLELSENTEFIHLPTGARYAIVQIASHSDQLPEARVLLRRIEA